MRIYKYIFSDERKEKDGNGNVASWQTEIIAQNKSKENERNIEMKSNATKCVFMNFFFFDERKEKDGNGNVASWLTEMMAHQWHTEHKQITRIDASVLNTWH